MRNIVKHLKKDITFIYSDSAEKAIYQPLQEEAEKRGYKTKLTDNPYEKCEIGFYCQHINFPQYSKFSLIMLHDIIQQYGNWPNIWYQEPWNIYDIGILPSDQWVDNWTQCSNLFYTRPRKGIYKVGWPKADVISKLKNDQYKSDFYKRYHLDPNKKTVLYAPAWENDNKEDDFVKAVLPLDVNIIVKQWDADPVKFPGQVENVKRMKELHQNIPSVTELPPATNIFEAIAASDLLISEESSTMCEAAMMGIPAISVSNWLIPDTTPSRYPKCDYTFVTETSKEHLGECIKNLFDHYQEACDKLDDFRIHNFSNIGKASSMIMDIIDDCVNGDKIRYQGLIAKRDTPLYRSEEKKFYSNQKRRKFYYRYGAEGKILHKPWMVAHEIKQKLTNK